MGVSMKAHVRVCAESGRQSQVASAKGDQLSTFFETDMVSHWPEAQLG